LRRTSWFTARSREPFRQRRLELDDVDAFHRRDGAEPPGAAAGAKADDE
jgi:hypothetical protein